jgi:hypothetical protein
LSFAVVVNRYQYIRKRKIRKNGYTSTTPVVTCGKRKQRNLDDCVQCPQHQGVEYLDDDLHVCCLVDIREDRQ